MQIAVVGHVDHGKSTIVGRLLADTGTLPEGRIEQIRSFCERNSRPFEYAFLLDALKDERAQGITIDAARIFFQSPKRRYVITDAPGHVEFLKNMVTGAARAEAALLVIDAREGVRENSRRHAYLLSMLGIRQLVVLVNKMDLLEYSRERYETVAAEFGDFLARIGIRPAHTIPAAGYTGENLARRSERMPWYAGPTLLEALDGFETVPQVAHAPFRLPVQDVYKFTAHGDTRRIVAGTVASGRARVGDEIVFYPSLKRARLSSIEAFPRGAPSGALEAGDSKGFTLEEQLYVTRGELAARAGEPAPRVGSRFKASLFWLGKRPLYPGKDYILKLGSARARARLERVLRVLDASRLEPREGAETIDRHEVGECVLSLASPIAFDVDPTTPATSRFVLVDDFEISGGGLVREELADGETAGRAARFGQTARLVVLAGPQASQTAARALEAQLWASGRTASTLEHDSLEGARALLDAGLVVIVPVLRFRRAEELREAFGGDAFRAVWLGPTQGFAKDAARAHLMAEAVEEPAVLQAVLEWTAAGRPG